jgi:catechol 2,3-dioxygenase-like lactoylglutathione lyase family enzyme
MLNPGQTLPVELGVNRQVSRPALHTQVHDSTTWLLVGSKTAAARFITMLGGVNHGLSHATVGGGSRACLRAAQLATRARLHVVLGGTWRPVVPNSNRSGSSWRLYAPFRSAQARWQDREVPSPSPYVVSYFTDDLDSNRRFYGEVIGLDLHSDLPDVYFLAGAGGWRLQILRTDADRPGRQTVSSGLVLIGVQTEEELASLHARLQAAGLDEADGYRDPDGRIVMVRLFDPSYPFHD